MLRPGDNITFNCTTSNSSILWWKNDDVIDQGGHHIELLYLCNDISQDQKQTLGLATAIILDSGIDKETGSIMLKSQINITIPDYEIPSPLVCCTSNGHNDSVEILVTREFSME